MTNTFKITDSREVFTGGHQASKLHVVQGAETVDDHLIYTAPCGTTGVESEVSWALLGDKIDLSDMCKRCAEYVRERIAENKSRPNPKSLGAHLDAQLAKQALLKDEAPDNQDLNAIARVDRRVTDLQARISTEGRDANA